jgi:hypothetical protein
MPEIAPKNYLAKIDEFAAHWPLVNAALPAPLILTGNYAAANLNTDRASLAGLIVALEAAINANEGAIATRDTLRASLKERIRQFNQAVRGFFPGSTHQRMLPRAPSFNAAPGIWMKAMADVHNVWTQINAITPAPVGAPIPLILAGGYALANFTAEQTALNAAFTTIETTQNGAATAVRNRDVLWRPVVERLKQYRLAVQGRFARGSALLDSLPWLTPPPGSTPAPVSASALWDAASQEAAVSYTASPHPLLAEYELRGSFGGTRYNGDAASVLGNHPAGDLTPFRTKAGLVASGSRVYYKVFVVLETGNERGSNTVSVTRP